MFVLRSPTVHGFTALNPGGCPGLNPARREGGAHSGDFRENNTEALSDFEKIQVALGRLNRYNFYSTT